jgi:hypothetical protein
MFLNPTNRGRGRGSSAPGINIIVIRQGAIVRLRFSFAQQRPDQRDKAATGAVAFSSLNSWRLFPAIIWNVAHLHLAPRTPWSALVSI